MLDPHRADSSCERNASDASRSRTRRDIAEFRKLRPLPGANEQRGLGSIVVTPKFPLNRESALNGLRFGFGIPEHQIKIVAGLHGAANMLNYDDYVWDKYQLCGR